MIKSRRSFIIGIKGIKLNRKEIINTLERKYGPENLYKTKAGHGFPYPAKRKPL